MSVAVFAVWSGMIYRFMAFGPTWWPHKDKFDGIYSACFKRIYYNSEARKSRKIDRDKICLAKIMRMSKGEPNFNTQYCLLMIA